jgi:DNA-binding NarL/FixJ family response regulator
MPAAAPSLIVWVVEDDTSFRDTLAFLLEHTTGMTCGHTFGSVEDALAYADAYEGRSTSWPQRDVMLLDVNLPGMTGLDGIAALKARLPDTQIVMLTIRDSANTIFDAFRAGASGYLLKNAGVDRIVAAVREAAAGGMLMPAPVARQVLGLFQRHKTPSDYGLTEREVEVLREMTEGCTQKEIAERLFVSPSTVNTHVQRIYAKLHVRSATEAVAKVLRERLLGGGAAHP